MINRDLQYFGENVRVRTSDENWGKRRDREREKKNVEKVSVVSR